MMLALLTYGRLDMYRSFVVTQGEFERYMVENERRPINNGAQLWYDWTTVTTKNGGSKKKPAPKDSTPLLNVYWIFHPEKSKDDPQREGIYKDLLKKVIYIVFGEQSEYKHAQDKNPNLVEDLVNAIATAGSKLTSEKKPIKTVTGLENLELDNPSLQDVYYWMIKGFRKAQAEKNKETSKAKTQEKSEGGEGEVEESKEGPLEEYVNQEDIISLLDFLTINANKSKIRVFLAPRVILMAIYGDPRTVDEIMQNRLELYHQAMNEKDNKPLTEQFKQKFSARAINVPETLLDFTVSTTNPSNYESQ